MLPRKKIAKKQPEYIWEYRQGNPAGAKEIGKRLQLKPILARILAARGMDDPAEVMSFINPTLSSIEDPLLLEEMDKALVRFKEALQDNQKICIYGDYDVDGITATVLLVRFIRWLGKKADYYIPNRISEGYGLNHAAIKQIAEKGTRLLVTVDNGISSMEEVAYANSLGIDVIITDHHQSGPALPPAVAVVDPNRKDALYHTPLAGVGVAFKLAHAVSRELGIEAETAKRFLCSLLDLVALGTVADVVPLRGENRTLVKYGLEKLQNTDKVGLSTLTQLTCGRDKTITSDSISYYLAPRLNAAGRNGKASLCVDLLLTEDNLKAIELSRRLGRLNEERRKLEADILESCLNLIDREIDMDDQHVLVIQGEGWHIGVVGIVASRLLESFYKPAIVLAVDRDIARGSGRSIAGFDLHKALTSCDDYLIEYGGHKRAVGLTLKAGDIPAFRKAINEYARDQIDPDMLNPRLTIDIETTADELTRENIEALTALEPNGIANPAPIFSMKNVSLLESPRIVGRDHLKLTLCQDGISLSGIGFSMGNSFPELSDTSRTFQIAFRPYINEWRGYKNVELDIKDIKFD